MEAATPVEVWAEAREEAVADQPVEAATVASSSAAIHHPRCEACYFVRRGNIAYVYCRVNPRHKQRQGPKHKQGTVQRPTAGFTHWSTRGVSWT